MKKLKTAFFLPLFIFLFLYLANTTYASLVTIDTEGKVMVNVLASEDSIGLEIPKRDFVAIKDIISFDAEPDAKVTLTKESGEIRLNISSKSGEKSMDVTDYEDEIVEIEERPEVERITVGVLDNKFTIKQKEVVAETDYEINIDPKSAGFTLKTPSGLRFLSILPREAVNTMLRTKLISRIDQNGSITIEESEGEIVYKIVGDKVINVFDVLEYPFAVTAKVSALTGEIIVIEDPKWLKFFGFLFV